MWTREVTVQPTTDPVTLDEVRDQLVIEHQDDDAWLKAKILEATVRVQEFASKACIEQTMKLRLDGWPSSGEIRLPRPPLISVTSIQYVDVDGNTQTWSSANYVVDAVAEPARITRAYGVSFPGLRAIPNNVIITYKAGCLSRGDVRLAPAREAILELLALWYSNREGVVQFGQLTALPKIENDILHGRLDPEYRCRYDYGEDCS